MTRLYYWLHAQSQYSIHSPFVFDLYRKVLFAQSNAEHFDSRYHKLCYRLANHYHLATLEQSDDTTLLGGNTINGQVLVVRQPHANRQAEQKWNTLKACNQYTVSIDVYSVGLLFTNPHLHPQHFLLR